MRTSIATVSVSGSLDEKLDAIAQAGFWGVEIFEADFLAYRGSPRDVAARLRSLGLTCTCFQPFRDFEGMPGPLRTRTFDRMERKFDLMQELGAKALLVCSNVSPAALADRARIVADFRELGDRAARRGITVGYEALAWGRHVNDHRDAWAIVREVDHPAIGIILDSFHSFARRVPVESIREIDPAKIVLVQLADAPQLHMDELSWSRHFRTMPFQGDFPITDYVGELHDIGFRGVYSLEIFNDRFRASPAASIALDGKRSLILLEDEVEQRRGAAPMPPRSRVEGIEFIEFAANDVEAPQLGRMLSTLGFAEVGRHKSKPVSRWKQGEINIVVNRDGEGFAHAHDMVHGASVCAIGLRVRDVPGALKRARALQIPVFSQPTAPGDAELAAIRGIGGSLLYFVEEGATEALWRSEFVPLENELPSAGCLGRFDHLAQVMQYDEMFSWLLFYVSLLDVEKKPMVEFADPLGLVQSQAIETRSRSLRMTLNASAANETLSARFLRAYTGAGVQYVAFQTDDVFRAADAMRERGIELLGIPANYYDDISARFDLPEEQLQRMRKASILYDRDESGEYLHYYCRAFAKRFFFEIIERRNYDGYGIANEPVRLASQARFKTAPAA